MFFQNKKSHIRRSNIQTLTAPGNKSLQSRAFQVGTLKNTYETEVGLSSDKSYYSYESGHGRKILREKSFQQSASQKAAGTRNNSSSISSDSDTFLQSFNQAFSRYTSVNAQRFFEQTLELYKTNIGVSLEINDTGSFACLNCGFLTSSNFYIYYTIGQNRDLKGD